MNIDLKNESDLNCHSGMLLSPNPVSLSVQSRRIPAHNYLTWARRYDEVRLLTSNPYKIKNQYQAYTTGYLYLRLKVNRTVVKIHLGIW